jgi:hypothetical protein
MLRRLLRWLSPVVLGILLAVPVCAQGKKDGTVPPADLRAKDDSSSGTGSGHLPIFEFILVIGGTALILLILCMPSRKR